MNAAYIIKRKNKCCEDSCYENFLITLNETNAIKLKEHYENQCKEDCQEDTSCFTYCIERLFITGDHEHILINGKNC